MTKGVQIAIATVCVFGALAWFISSESAGEGTFRYYKTVADYLEQGPQASGPALRGSRVHGFVLDGSIEKDLRAGIVEFVIRDDSAAQLPVRYHGSDVPDLFKDGAEIVVEGHLAEGVFVADRMMAKCPSKYEAREESGAEA
jgi:cytochrome c-type biogenesis protein CcmE